MDHPISPTYLEVQTVRAAAILPAAGAWDATPLELHCSKFDFVTFYITYTRGAVGGAVDFALQVSPRTTDLAGVEDWFQQAILAGGAVAANADTTSLTQREVISYGATAAAAESFVYGPVELRGTVERLRMPCCESGDTDNPGTAHIIAVFAMAVP